MADRINSIKECYLSVEKMNAIHSLFQDIQDLFSNCGYELTQIPLNTVKVTYDINIEQILNVLNDTESNIQIIEKTSDWINPYYAEFEWTKNTPDKKKHVDRWIYYLSHTYNVLNKTTYGSQYLIDENGNYITDKYGNYILVYKEWK